MSVSRSEEAGVVIGSQTKSTDNRRIDRSPVPGKLVPRPFHACQLVFHGDSVFVENLKIGVWKASL